MTYTILLVEDDEHIMTINRNKLHKVGYRVLEAKTLHDASTLLETESPDLIALDIMLPDGDGVKWCKELRSGSPDPPILFLSAKNEILDILDGFKAGGDDYLTKPYDLNILLAHIKALLDRTLRMPQTIKKGSLVLDIASSRAYIDSVDLTLKPMEYGVLLFLAQNEGQAVSAETLYEKVWGQPMSGDKNALQKTISCIRKKIEPAGYTINGIYGKGEYILERI